MAKTLESMWKEVVVAFEHKRWDEALRRCIVILQGAPSSFEARMKIADILLKQGHEREAAEVYKVVAWHFTKAGFPLLGIVAIKMLTAFEDSYNAVLEVLAGLYSADSDRVSKDVPPQCLPDLSQIELSNAGLNVDSAIPLEGRALVELASKLARDEKGLDDYPSKLPAIPLFSDLPEDAFARVLRDLRLNRLAGDGVVIKEGERGNSFYLLARGHVEVRKKVGSESLVLARLSDGSVFGEMALVSSEPRSATVRALSHLDLLELGREDLERGAKEMASVSKALLKFTRARMLNNLMALSAVFRTLPSADRHRLLDCFVSMEMSKGQVLIEEGLPGPGLFVLLRGEVEVKKREGETLVPLALLREGDVFGEISLIKESPTTATVIAGADGELLYLSRSEFEKQVRQNPDLWKTLTEIGDERLKETSRLMTETGFLSDDEFVLV
ncbi:MAG: cyclic nucleotide-binding domain-containing protein [Deltaproteobacteria bacterium]|nr:cyclic nucleotide-binding domain-containing protein [Deltaproteobacteria bacterium]